MKLIIVVNELWFFLSHRLPIALAARDAGYEVHIASRSGTSSEIKQLNQESLQFHPISFRRSSTGLWQELKTLNELRRLYKEIHPDIVHHVTIKPVLYGTLAARWVGGIQILNAISGLGYLFIAQGWKASIRKKLLLLGYRAILRSKKVWILFQNPDDQALFTQHKIIFPGHKSIIKGSGVDLQQFAYSPTPEGKVKIILVARMLWDKGVGEFVESATRLKQQGLDADFVLVGSTDPGNPKSISTKQLEQWNELGVVKWLGERIDIAQLLIESHIAVLPSYREGLPKSLIEAAAIGRAIVATNVPGCREVVKDGENGILVSVKNVKELTTAIQKIINNPELLISMGKKSRLIAEQEFSIQQVVKQTLKLYKRLKEL
ncbi:glycosyltransferase family 4 protein [Candidatus Woesearchaeota archaeon]|nr:glycosyltransferase family 4 protein [Candidatus Woesearchaeota archaeon]